MNHLLGVLPLVQVVEVAAAVMVEEVAAAVAVVLVAAAYGAVNRYAADVVHMVPLAT